VIIFGSVWFLPKNNNQTDKKKDPKPAQTDRFRSDFLSKKPENPYAFFWAFLAL
jgi:hypothetical protein